MESKETKQITIYIDSDLLQTLDINIAMNKKGFRNRTQYMNNLLRENLYKDVMYESNKDDLQLKNNKVKDESNKDDLHLKDYEMKDESSQTLKMFEGLSSKKNTED